MIQKKKKNVLCFFLSERVHPANAILPGELFYYYSGDCSDSTVQESIKNNFVDVMKNLEGSDGWDNICPDYCTVEGVTVTCGPLNGRRRRSIVTRSTDKEIVVDFKVSSQWETTKNLWGNDDTLQALGDLIKLEVSNGAVDVNGTTTGSMTFGWIEFPCEIGQEPVYEADARCGELSNFNLMTQSTYIHNKMSIVYPKLIYLV